MKNIKFGLTIQMLLWIIVIAGCSQKGTQPANLKNFLPTNNNATRYLYKSISSNKTLDYDSTNSIEMLVEKLITTQKDNCITLDNYLLLDPKKIQDDLKNILKNNRLKGATEKYCTEKNKITLNSMILYKRNNNWQINIEYQETGKKTHIIKANCHFVSMSRKFILGKKRNIIHSQCSYSYQNTADEINFFLAEHLGLYKIVQFSKSPAFNLDGAIVTSLIEYE